MTVYVDDMYLYPLGELKLPGGRVMKMSHMVADTREELVAMARAIGVQQRHIQKLGTDREHFDICKSYRDKAIKAGAVPITLRQCSAMCVRRRETGALGNPEDAEAWRDKHAKPEAPE
ncbi:DUF4031 domain-containing protein [Paraburkholderia phenoliruptrix]|uniref:DUF4031 domain-containing protein n=1 Tax=Paraburkholderia phenoliruptrix TaxID=252970 RepID=UPI001C4ED1B4|nr:DUF4031 domain-containing protein [Paraburkholderia phenoliruptrix]MBW0450866.1 DUF4031 domain-containing protein [Paraburkholderia phenoliruptrix]MBW9100959.1 DUF4031 domain-containing protein [Paraburkholderia phenoliruptrix]